MAGRKLAGRMPWSANVAANAMTCFEVVGPYGYVSCTAQGDPDNSIALERAPQTGQNNQLSSLLIYKLGEKPRLRRLASRSRP